MKNKNKNIAAKIKAVSGRSSSHWEQQSQYLIENKKWLDYSARIALRIAARIEDNPQLTQATLAKALKMPKQQVSRMLRGDQNLTLKTIAKLSDVIGFELITFPNYKDSYIQLNADMPTNRPAAIIPLMHLQQPNGFYPVNQTIANG